MLAALNERDVAARGRANVEGVSEAEIQQMLQTMIKQRREAITLYDQGNRPDLAQRERDEIAVIDGFLPRQFEAAEIEQAAAVIIAGIGASGMKDMARSWPHSAIAMQGSWISPVPVRLSDGSWAEPETDCEEISLTVSHLYVNSKRSYRRVAGHGVSSRGSFVPLGAKGPGSLRRASGPSLIICCKKQRKQRGLFKRSPRIGQNGALVQRLKRMRQDTAATAMGNGDPGCAKHWLIDNYGSL
jgi:uncharacterized protein YqeY